MPEALFFRCQRFFLAQLQPCFFQFLQRLFQRFHAVLLLLILLDQARVLPMVGDERLIRRVHAAEQRLIIVAARSIQKQQVILRVHQKLRLVLTMHVHQQYGDVFERGQRHHHPADTAEVAPGACDFAVERYRAVEIIEFLRLRPFCNFRIAAGIKHRLDPRLVRSRADEFPRGASAQHQIDRVHDDGFARAGFAGHNVQPFAEFQTQFLNQRDIPHSHG